MSESWDIDPASGDYLLVDGNPVPTESLRIPAYVRLKVRRTQWLYAPDENYGSDYYTVKKRQTSREASSLEAIGARALQPMLDDGRASEIDVTAQTATRGSAGLQATILDAQGQPDQLNLQSLGV